MSARFPVIGANASTESHRSLITLGPTIARITEIAAACPIQAAAPEPTSSSEGSRPRTYATSANAAMATRRPFVRVPTSPKKSAPARSANRAETIAVPPTIPTPR